MRQKEDAKGKRALRCVACKETWVEDETTGDLVPYPPKPVSLAAPQTETAAHPSPLPPTVGAVNMPPAPPTPRRAGDARAAQQHLKAVLIRKVHACATTLDAMDVTPDTIGSQRDLLAFSMQLCQSLQAFEGATEATAATTMPTTTTTPDDRPWTPGGLR